MYIYPMIYYPTTCSQADVTAAISSGTIGDIVQMPAGTGVWGTGGSAVFISQPILLAGAGTGQTIISRAPDAPGGTAGTIQLFHAVTVSGFSILGSPDGSVFAMSSVNGWRVTNLAYIPTGNISSTYFARVNGVYGVIDHCYISGAFGTDELIFATGPSDAWSSPLGMGTTGAVYVEDCVFDGPGYVNDANYNSKMVIRFCEIRGNMKIDGHGLASNGTPPTNAGHGVRLIEAYNNRWTATGGSFGGWSAMELRGGKNMVFNNTIAFPDFGAFFLTDYGYLGAFGGFQGIFQTPLNYPLPYQIGVGNEQVFSVSGLSSGKWSVIFSSGNTDFTQIGASSNASGTYFCANGTGGGNGLVKMSYGRDPSYIWNNYRTTATTGVWNRILKVVSNQNGWFLTAQGPVATGALSINLNTTVPAVGNVLVLQGDPNRYMITGRNGDFAIIQYPGLKVAIPAAGTGAYASPIYQWEYQTGFTGATFTERDIIQANRDFYASDGFDGTINFAAQTGISGIGIGTYAQMSAITPITSGVGWWATDRGTWWGGPDMLAHSFRFAPMITPYGFIGV